MSDYIATAQQNLDVSGARIAIVMARFNHAVVSGLRHGAEKLLATYDLSPHNVLEVPGAYEIPLAAQQLIATQNVDAIIALGAIIRGDTAHFEFVASECTRGLGRVMLDTNRPIGFGVLTCDDETQARIRSNDDTHNKGREAALAVLEMVALARHLHAES